MPLESPISQERGATSCFIPQSMHFPIWLLSTSFPSLWHSCMRKDCHPDTVPWKPTWQLWDSGKLPWTWVTPWWSECPSFNKCSKEPIGSWLVDQSGQLRLPITPDIFWQLKGSWERHTSRVDASMLKAAATFRFFTFLRTGEAVTSSDSRFDSWYHSEHGDVQVNINQKP